MFHFLGCMCSPLNFPYPKLFTYHTSYEEKNKNFILKYSYLESDPKIFSRVRCSRMCFGKFKCSKSVLSVSPYCGNLRAFSKRYGDGDSHISNLYGLMMAISNDILNNTKNVH